MIKKATTSAARIPKAAVRSPAKTAVKPAGKPAAEPATKPTAKPAPKTAARQPAAAPAKAVRPAASSLRSAPAASAAAAAPSMRFYHSKALRTKTHAVLAALEAAPDHPRHGDALADLVSELIEAGMDYYFMRALKQAQVGFVTEQSARIGMSGAIKLISSVNRKFILRMDKHQLLVVAQHIRELG